MKPFIVALVCAYLVMAYLLFRNWLYLFKKDGSLDRTDKLFSTVTLVVATILWPVIVPFAYLQLLKQKNDEAEGL